MYWPIYAAAEKHALPLCIHAGSTFRHATTSNGWPSYYLEDYVVMSHAFQAQLLSLVAEGVFTKFPDLTVVLAESGFTWLPQFMWRQVKTWRAMRAEIPWVDRAPAEIIRENVRFTLQPTDAPPEPDQLAQAIDMIGTDRALLFSTDYPHWQFDGDDALPAGLRRVADPQAAGGQPARHLSPSQGDRRMSQSLLDRTAARPARARPDRLRRASRDALA